MLETGVESSRAVEYCLLIVRLRWGGQPGSPAHLALVHVAARPIRREGRKVEGKEGRLLQRDVAGGEVGGTTDGSGQGLWARRQDWPPRRLYTR